MSFSRCPLSSSDSRAPMHRVQISTSPRSPCSATEAMGGTHHELQPDLQRQDHRLVSRRDPVCNPADPTRGKTTGPLTSPTRTSRQACPNQAADFVAAGSNQHPQFPVNLGARLEFIVGWVVPRRRTSGRAAALRRSRWSDVSTSTVWRTIGFTAVLADSQQGSDQ